jgi:hypothetical protein
MANRYYDDLKAASKRLDDLADKLAAQRAQPLSKEERAFVRMAVLSKVFSLLQDMGREFMRGGDPMVCEASIELCKIAADLKD